MTIDKQQIAQSTELLCHELVDAKCGGSLQITFPPYVFAHNLALDDMSSNNAKEVKRTKLALDKKVTLFCDTLKNYFQSCYAPVDEYVVKYEETKKNALLVQYQSYVQQSALSDNEKASFSYPKPLLADINDDFTIAGSGKNKILAQIHSMLIPSEPIIQPEAKLESPHCDPRPTDMSTISDYEAMIRLNDIKYHFTKTKDSQLNLTIETSASYVGSTCMNYDIICNLTRVLSELQMYVRKQNFDAVED